jgi:hypothetical protein
MSRDRLDRDKFGKMTEISAHTPGTPKGEERIAREGREPGREDPGHVRTARDSTGISAEARRPIDPKMPDMPPA